MKEKTNKSSKKLKKDKDGKISKNKNKDKNTKKRRIDDDVDDEDDLIMKEKQKDTATDTDIVVDKESQKKKKKKKDKSNTIDADVDVDIDIVSTDTNSDNSPLKNNNDTDVNAPVQSQSQYQSNEDICNNVDRTLFIDNITNTIPTNKSSYISVQEVVDFISNLVLNIVVLVPTKNNTNISKDKHKKEYIDNINIPVWNDTQKIRGYGHITLVSKDYATQLLTTYNEYVLSTNSNKNMNNSNNFTFYNKIIRFQYSKQPIKNKKNDADNNVASSIHDVHTGIEKTVSTTLILNNLSFTATDTDIYTALRTMVENNIEHDSPIDDKSTILSTLLSPLDSIVDITIPQNKTNSNTSTTSTSKGYAYIVFETTQAARRIMILASSSSSSLEENPLIICGRPCRLDYYHKTTTNNKNNNNNSPHPFGLSLSSPAKILLSSLSDNKKNNNKTGILSRSRSLSLNRINSSGKVQRSRTASPIKTPGSSTINSSSASIDNKMRPYNLKY